MQNHMATAALLADEARATYDSVYELKHADFLELKHTTIGKAGQIGYSDLVVGQLYVCGRRGDRSVYNDTRRQPGRIQQHLDDALLRHQGVDYQGI